MSNDFVSGQADFLMVLAIGTSAAAICTGLVLILRPTLQRHLLAKPNERSSHRRPTAQGGGLAVIAATVLTAAGTFQFVEPSTYFTDACVVLAAAVFLGLVGLIDDIRTIPVAPRLLLQAAAVVVVISFLPPDIRVFQSLPWLSERALFFVGGVWFVNLVNFMDGIDWMTVVETVPLTTGISVLGLLGAIPPEGTVVALALLGAMLGFAPFNRPIAEIFLGDVGSLPIGLLIGWLLLLLAAGGHVVAALLLPMYYLADTAVTILRRAGAGKKVWQAHREHFYQRAANQGFTVMEIVGRVFAVNFLLAIFALLSVLNDSITFDVVVLFFGSAVVAGMMSHFAKGRQCGGS